MPTQRQHFGYTVVVKPLIGINQVYEIYILQMINSDISFTANANGGDYRQGRKVTNMEIEQRLFYNRPI